MRRNVRPVNALLIEEEEALARLLRRPLEFGGCRVTRFASDADARAAVDRGASEFDVVVLRLVSAARLQRLRELAPKARFIEVWQRDAGGKGPARPDRSVDGAVEMPFEVQDLGPLALRLGRRPATPLRPADSSTEPPRRQRAGR